MKKYSKNVYSQFGEDGILLEIANRINAIKYFVEFGGWDGYRLSNVANLRDAYGWDGIMFELDGNRCKNNEKHLKIYDQAIYSDNINEVFKKHSVPYQFGIISIDIDGDDYYVWKALDEKYQPEIVVIEYNPFLPNDTPMIYVEQKEKQNKENIARHYYNSNMLAMLLLGQKKGYKFVCNTQTNIIFVKEHLFHLLQIEEQTIQEIISNEGNQHLKHKFDKTSQLPWLKEH